MDRRTSWLDRVKGAAPASGSLALAAFAVCVLTGLPLLLVYDPNAPLGSLALALMRNPAGSWVRSMHFWSAQGLLVVFLLHLIERLVRREETRCRFGAWLRFVLTGPVILLALASGTILRGDALGHRTAALIADLLDFVPPAGRLLAFVLFGSGSGSHVVWWHHGLAIPLLLALLLRGRFQRLAPAARPLGWMLAGTLALAALFAPGLGAYPAPVSPWYLAALADFMRWIPEPGLAVGLALTTLLALALLPLLARPLRTTAKCGLAAALVACAVATAASLIQRPPPSAENAGIRPHFLSFRAYLPAAPALRRAPVATIAGRPEGCLSCHGDMTGFAPAHQPAALGCTGCHLGNPFTLDARLAHAGMTLTPGNLSIVRQTCATAGCHADIADRVEASLMNTMSGVVAVDKVAFGESRDLNRTFAVAHLGHSPADRHLRNLCASCHLGLDKSGPAAIDQQSRGGGCSACHLNYGADPRAELDRRGGPRPAAAPRHHPDISARLAANACFGCHSRSGRISLNFEGWSETLLDEPAARKSPGWPAHYRTLADGRIFERQAADVHFERGMTCTDCHLAAEIMGDGRAHAHEADAVKIACVDCHPDRPPATATFAQLDPETQRLVALRRPNLVGCRLVRTRSGDISYPNVFLDPTGGIALETGTGALLHPKAPSPACGRDILAHQKLECRTCHSAWAPQCLSCHTSFDPGQSGWDHLAGRLVRGVWQETPGDFRADPPVLGVEQIRSGAGEPAERVSVFVPGMVMTLNQTMGAAKVPDAFHRLYAPTSPHTTVTRTRDCRSCHADPLALGYGRGVLKYDVKNGAGHWTFTPALARSPYDGLPLDAWIGFMEDPKAPAATRTNVRPFNREEQRRMLLVGACLECHSEKEPAVAAAFSDFDHYRDRLGPRCALPDWIVEARTSAETAHSR